MGNSRSVESDITYLRSLSTDQLEQELMGRRWYAHPQDLIGGYCVMPVDAPPSCGCFEIADTLSKELAEHIANLHNQSLS